MKRYKWAVIRLGSNSGGFVIAAKFETRVEALEFLRICGIVKELRPSLLEL